MRRIVLAALSVIVALALSMPAWAQTDPTENVPPSNNQNSPGGNNAGAAILGGIIGAVVTGIVIQSIQNAQGGDEPPPQTDTPPPQTPSVTKPTRIAPIFRDVPPPPARPSAFNGRPVRLDVPFDPTKVLVMLQPGSASPAEIVAAINEETGMALSLIESHEFALGGLRTALFRIPADRTVEEVLNALKNIPGILGAQPQYTYVGAAGDNADADLRGLQYAPERLNALAARAEGTGTGVIIGLIDTGVDLTQPALMGADIEALDVMSDRPVQGRDHGTALAGLMLAGHTLDGIAPGAHLISVRAFDTGPDGAAISGSYEIAAAIDLAVEKGARVLNLSFAGPRDPLVMSVLDAAAEKGVILVAAVGNGGPEAPPAYPGAHRDAIAVTATDARNGLFAGANRGHYIAVAAPGVDVLSPMPEDNFELLSGTSIATAHISAVIALMLEQDPALTPEEVAEVLESSASDLGEPGPDAEYGAGLANAEAAVETARRLATAE